MQILKSLKLQIVVAGVVAALGLVAFSAAESAFAVINDQIMIDNSKAINLVISSFTSNRANLKPGDSLDGEFKISSNAYQSTDVFLSVAPFTINKETEKRDYETESARTNMVKWTTLELLDCDITKTENNRIYFTMRPQEQCRVKYHIKVPNDAMGGSQNMGIFVQSILSGDDPNMIGREYRVGHLVSVDIDGPGALWRGNVVYNHIPCILFNPPLAVGSRVENTGNMDFGVDYHVNIKNYFGGYEMFDKTWGDMVMADGRHTTGAAWEGAPALGLFLVTQEIKFLDEVSAVTKLVLIIPIWLIVLTAVVLGLLIWALILKIRKYRREKQNKIIK